MNKLMVLILAIVIVCTNAKSSYCSGEWSKAYGGSGVDGVYSIQKTDDGGYILAGSSSSSIEEENDLWVVKMDSAGSISWQKTFGGNGNDYATSIQQTADDGYIVSGTTYSTTAGDANIWILKLSSSGTVNWQKSYGGTDNDYATSIQQTTDDGYIVSGNTKSFGSGHYDIWVLKLNSTGDIIWENTYGGTEFDWAFSVRQTSDSGYIVIGDTFSFGIGEDDIIVLKLESDGSIAWQKTYGGSSYDWPFKVEQTADGGYIIAGDTFSSGAGQNDIWVLKLDSSGGITWQKIYGGSDFDWPCAVQQTTDGGYILSGGSYSFGSGKDDILVIKLDSSGSVSWEKSFGSGKNDHATSVHQASDGSYIVFGGTSSFGAGYDDILVLTLDSNGESAHCTVLDISNLSVGNTSVTGLDVNVTVQQSSGAVTDTNISPQDGSLEVTDVCGEGIVTTTTSSILPTTTTTVICQMEAIYGGDSEEVEVLRTFRNDVLSQTPEGREIIKLYYEWSPTIIKAMREDETFKDEIKNMVDVVLELIRETE